MGVVGQFPLMSDLKRRTIRAPVNPLDVCSVVSIYPKHIPPEIKPTLTPGVFQIPYGTYEKPGVLVVGPSSWWKELDENQPLLEIPASSVQIAESIVKDWANGIYGCDMGENMPGLFFVPGCKHDKHGEPDVPLTIEWIQKEKKHLLDEANRRQRNWFQWLVKAADTSWARSNGSPLAISDDMRMAARELNLIQKEWLADAEVVDLVRCKACGHLKNPAYPICPNCKSIDDPAKALMLGLKFAQ
jgi:hypothetical protein